MKVKSFSLLSCLLVYVAVILFTLGGSQIGETHDSETLHDLFVRGNTGAIGVTLDNGDIDIYLRADGDGRSPADVDGSGTIACFHLVAKVTGKEPDGEIVFRINGGRAYAHAYNSWTAASGSEVDEAKAEVSLYATLSFQPDDELFNTYVIHHHEVESNYPPYDLDEDDDTNVGAQGHNIN